MTIVTVMPDSKHPIDPGVMEDLWCHVAPGVDLAIRMQLRGKSRLSADDVSRLLAKMARQAFESGAQAGYDMGAAVFGSDDQQGG